MSQRNERLSFPAMMLEEITLHLGVPAAIAMLVADYRAVFRARGGRRRGGTTPHANPHHVEKTRLANFGIVG
jgi:hypothetical protein